LAAGDAAAEGSSTSEVISSAFIPLIEGAVAEYIGKWQERPAPGGASWEQQHEPELLKDELRPLVFEEVRQQVRPAAGGCVGCVKGGGRGSHL
jgi:hypothetical protein